MLRKSSALRALLIVLAISGHAQAAACPPAPAKPTPEMEQAALRNARDHGFLWRISKGGRSSYLYGTIHVGKYEWMFPGPQVRRALESADTVALEIDVLDPDMTARLEKRIGALHAMSLPAPVARRMRQQAVAVCAPYSSIAKLPPLFQVETLSLMEGRMEGLEPAYAVDGALAAFAHAARKTVVSLETPELQLDVLESPDERETLALVEDELAEMERGEGKAYLRRIARYWEESNYADMSRFETWCKCLDTEAKRKFMKSLLDDRNPVLADRIDTLHVGGKQVFAAVGSLHLFGPQGLPALMEKRGYKVERIEWMRP